MRDYGWVKSKYLMDIRTVPFHKILIFIGLIGFLLIIILFPIVSFIPCNTFINVNINNYTYVENNEIKYISNTLLKNFGLYFVSLFFLRNFFG